jgi:ribosome biogenesis GTPase
MVNERSAPRNRRRRAVPGNRLTARGRRAYRRAVASIEPAPRAGAAAWLVTRADRGAVLVVPADDPSAEPVRVRVGRDGLVDSDEGRVPPAVGDLVALDETGDEAVRLGPRRSALVRDSADRSASVQVLAANVDVVLVVEHLDPDPDLGRIERLLTLAWRSGAQPVVVLTKADLVPDVAGMAADVAAVAPGAPVHAVSVPTGLGVAEVAALATPGRVLVVVGPSGAGKSTLVNALVGGEVMTTGGLRADGRGRHTTTHRELVVLPGGALLVDTPGLRSIGLVADPEALDATFSDIAELAEGCRFRDCRHESEPGCAVLAAIDDGTLPERRLASWRRLAREAAFQARRTDARLAAAERARWRQIALASRHARR